MKHLLATILIFIFVSCQSFISSASEIHSDIPHNNLSYPVLIRIGDKQSSGFLFKNSEQVFLATARHCLYRNTFETIDLNPDSDTLPDLEKLPYELKHRISIKPIINPKSKIIDKIYFEFVGTMSEKDKTILQDLYPSDENFRSRIKSIFENSQDLKLHGSMCNLTAYPFNVNSNEINEYVINLDQAKERNGLYYHPVADVSAVLLADIKTEKEDSKFKVQFLPYIKMISVNKGSLICITEKNVRFFDEVVVSNTVFLFGYPTSLTKSPALDIKIPLLRKGIIAGKNNQLKTIILDCPAFRGNSGGLVLQVEEGDPFKKNFRAIGIASQFVPFYKGKVFPENSGYSIAVPLDFLFDIIDE